MKPYQERVVVEKDELEVKIKKLVDFISGEIFSHLDLAERDMLTRQLSRMVQYSKVLIERINYFAAHE